jgi:hypothetical protein
VASLNYAAEIWTAHRPGKFRSRCLLYGALAAKDIETFAAIGLLCVQVAELEPSQHQVTQLAHEKSKWKLANKPSSHRSAALLCGCRTCAAAGKAKLGFQSAKR